MFFVRGMFDPYDLIFLLISKEKFGKCIYYISQSKGINVTSFSVFHTEANSEYWSQKCTLNGYPFYRIIEHNISIIKYSQTPPTQNILQLNGEQT